MTILYEPSDTALHWLVSRCSSVSSTMLIAMQLNMYDFCSMMIYTVRLRQKKDRLQCFQVAMQSNSPYFSRIEWHGIAKLNIGPAIQRPCNRTRQRAVVNFVERINQQNVRPHPTANTELPSKHPQAFVLSTRKVEVTHTNITATAANAVMIVRSKNTVCAVSC